jgi:hypothetical protein
MSNFKAIGRLLAATSLVAASLAACHDGNSGSSPSTPPPNQTTQFSAFAEQAFAAGPNSAPVSLDNVTFNYDVNDDPTAFDGLIMSGSI